MTLATRQPDVFQTVPLDAAFDAGVRRLGPVAALKEGPAGDQGEAIVMRDLMREGHTDIHSLQNRSGWGVDVTYRNKHTAMVDYMEVKTSARGIAKNQSGDPGEKINDWLNDLIGRKGHWEGDNVDPETVMLAERLRSEIEDNNYKFDGYWARLNLSNDAKTGELIIDKRVDRWLTPEERTQQRQQNKSATLGGPFEDTAFNNVYPALQSGDDRVVRASLDQLLQSPQAQAIMAHGADVLRQKEMEEERLAQERKTAMQATMVAQAETRSGYSR